MEGFAFVPEAALEIGGEAAPGAVMAALMSVSCKMGMEGVDQAEIVLANDLLQFLDDGQFRVGKGFAVDLGSADRGLRRVFTGEIVAKSASFGTEGNTLTVTAQDRRHNMADGTKSRWVAIPVPSVGNFPVPDPLTASVTTLENFMLPLIDPVGAAIGVILGGLDVGAVLTEPGSAQKMIRKQADESDLDFLKRIAKENGWDMVVEHDKVDGHVLRFQSSLDRLDAEQTFTWGRDMLAFEARLSKVGQLDVVAIAVWVPEIKTTFTVELGWDWDRFALILNIYPGAIPLGAGGAGKLKIDEPASPWSAGRMLVSELIPRLNKRITATAKVPGNPGLRAGTAIRINGAGEDFGGLYRITELTHKLGMSGFITELVLRKDVWFGSVPSYEQGASPIRPSAL